MSRVFCSADTAGGGDGYTKCAGRTTGHVYSVLEHVPNNCMCFHLTNNICILV